MSFGHEVVNMILQYETVGNLALWGDVMEYSRRNSTGEGTERTERKHSEVSFSPTAASSLQGTTQATTPSPRTPPRKDYDEEREDHSEEIKTDGMDNLAGMAHPTSHLCASQRNRTILEGGCHGNTFSSILPAFAEWDTTT